jgi:hypothetical protein
MPQIELLTVANHAEAINGLLYLSGAGWTDLSRTIQPGGAVPMNHIGIAVAILVSWMETNQRHRVGIRMENADGQTLINVQGEMEMGRPVGVLQGSDLRGVMAINGEIQFPSAGVYRVIASVGEDAKSVTFRVHDNPTPGSPPPGPAAAD